LTARPSAPAGGEETPFSGGELAETDDADTGNHEKTEGELTAANRDWLGRILWDGPPPAVAHLASFEPGVLPSAPQLEPIAASASPVPVEVPADLFDGVTDIETIEIIGLPEGAAMNVGHAGGEGIWLLGAGDVEGLELLPADDHWSVANLTVKVTATESASGDKVTNMAAIRMEIAGSPSEPPEAAEAMAKPEPQEADGSSEEGPEPDVAPAAVDIRHLVPPPPEPQPQPETPAEAITEPAPETPPDTAAAETAEEPEAPEQETIEGAAPETEPAESETKTASVKLQPVKATAQKPAVKPSPQPKKAAGASVRLRPATVRKVESAPADISEQPETVPPAKPAGRKAGVVLKKPEPPSPTTPGERRRPTGEIVVRLGGAPERGDPHYRIAVDGRQVASGNVDWALGLPAVEEGGEAAVCWQTVRFPWDFESVVPDEISVRYELGHGSGTDDSGALLVDWIDVDGLRIRNDETYTHADDGRVPWPGSDRLKSWVGELVFDVAGAFAGEPRRKRDRKAGGPDASGDADDEAGKATQEPAPQPLVVHVSEEDAADRVVISELAALRSFVQGRDDPRIDPDREDTYGRLGLASGSWSDVVAIGPDGEEIDLDEASDTRRFSVRAGEQLKRRLLSEAARRAKPAPPETTVAGRRGEVAVGETVPPSTEAPVSVESGQEMKRNFLAGVINRLPFMATPEAAEASEAVAPADKTPSSRTLAAFDKASDIKHRYLDGILRKGMTRLETVLDRQKDVPVAEAAPFSLAADGAADAPVPVRIGDGDPIPKRQAARTVRDFYGRTLKRALDKLQSTVFESNQEDPRPPHPEPRRPASGSMSGGPGEAATRDFAERMRSEFFDNAMRKAMARGAASGVDGRG